MSSGALPPLFENTATDQGAPPVVLGYIGASITLLVTGLRLFLTLHKKHAFRSDDYFFLTGAAFAFAASITLERAVDEGLGRHADALTSGPLNAFTKLSYATSLLSIFSQSAAKISVAFLFERIAPRQDKRGITILLSCISVWIVFAVFATAFSCSGKVYWAASCRPGGWLAFPILITDFITDLMLTFWMVPRIWKLQASRQHRIVPIILMSSRLLVCAAEVGQLGYLGRLRSRVPYNGADETWYAVMPATIGICIVHLSIITATIPRINSFVADIQTRKAGLTFTPRDYENYRSGSNSNNRSANQHSQTGYSRSRSPATVLQDLQDSFRPDQRHQTQQTTEIGAGRRAHSRSHPGRSQAGRSGSDEGDAIEMMDIKDGVETSSQSSLRGNAVYQKTEFRWEEEYTGQSSVDPRHRPGIR